MYQSRREEVALGWGLTWRNNQTLSSCMKCNIKNFDIPVLIITIYAWRGCSYIGRELFPHSDLLNSLVLSSCCDEHKISQRARIPIAKELWKGKSWSALWRRARLFWGDLSHFSLELAPGRRWECVDRCESLILVREEAARCFGVWLCSPRAVVVVPLWALTHQLKEQPGHRNWFCFGFFLIYFLILDANLGK